MKKPLATALLVACCAGLAASPAYGQLFGGDSEARQQIDELRQRIDAMARSQLEQTGGGQAMQSEIAGLRGQVEVLTHRLDELQQRQQDFYLDLDRRLQVLEGTGAAAGTMPPPSGVLGASAGTDGAASAPTPEYEAALKLLKAGKQADALAAFNRFIASNPMSPSLPGAHFWAGTAALQARDIATAQSHFNTVLRRWPQSRMAADAMLGLANTQEALGDTVGREQSLQALVRDYADSKAAAVARERLAR